MRSPFTRRFALIVAGMLLVLLSQSAVAAPDRIFFTAGGLGGPEPGSGPGVVRSVLPDGSGLQTVVTGLDRPRGIAVDSLNGLLFWNDWGNEITRRANLDGSNVQTVIDHGQQGLNDIALDVTAEKVYIGMSVSFEPFHGVKRFDYDGGSPEFIVDVLAGAGCSGVPKAGDDKGPPSCGWFVDGVGVDPANGHVYYGDVGVLASPDRGIGRADLDGSNQVQLVPHLDGRGRGMGLDIAGGKMYFAEHTTGGGRKGVSVGQIWRANLDGSALEVIVPGLNRPRDVALDLTEGHIYWVDEQLGIIGRADLDGGNVVTIVSGLDAPDSLDLFFQPRRVIPTLGYLGLALLALLLGGLGVLGLRRRLT